MRLALVITLALGLAPAAAAAKDQLRFDPHFVLDCLQGGGWDDCVGAAAEACAAGSAGGADSLRVGALCAALETAYWEEGLAELLAEIIARDDTLDAAVGVDPQQGPRSALLTGLHEAWRDFRDLSCVYEGLRWGTPAEAAAAEAGCRMRLTGEHVLVLRSYAAEG